MKTRPELPRDLVDLVVWPVATSVINSAVNGLGSGATEVS
jgi:hypothetical protein